MKLHQAVDERILQYCKERNITPNKLCPLPKVIQSTVNSIFFNRIQNPKLATIQYLCDGLDITLAKYFDNPLFIDLEY